MRDLIKHPAHSYAVAVRSGEIVAGKLVRQACGKYLDEIGAVEHGGLRGLKFDTHAAQHTIDFFAFLQHSKGEWAKQIFILEPWQQFILWNVFGWKRADGTRRYRTAYVEVARKNGKTTLLAGVGLYMLTSDGEGGAEIYSVATKREQAKQVWGEAKRMVEKAPDDLKNSIYCSGLNMSVDETASKFEPLAADANTLDGLNVHCAIVDELHAHRSANLYAVLDTSTGSRRQPLMFSITTAGDDQHSFCYEQREYAEQVVTGVIEDDSFFSYIASIDKGDAWDDPAVWIKANPNLGISVKREAIKIALAKAKHSPSTQDLERRYRINEWLQATSRFIDLAKWDANAGDLMPAEIEKATLGRVGYGGLDLSMLADISAFVAIFQPAEEGDPIDIVAKFWIPEEDLAGRERKGRAPYQRWVDEGWITATPGAVIDYTVVRDEIIEFSEGRTLLQTAYDPWNAGVLVTELEKAGLDMVAFRQGIPSFNYPTKEFEAKILTGSFRHGMNPVLRWMVDNLTVRSDTNGNIMPYKEQKMSYKKIDGVVALIMALDRLIRNEGSVPTQSIYEERGVLVL